MKIDEKYPKDFQEFLAQFPDEKACWHYLIDMRWKVWLCLSQVPIEKILAYSKTQNTLFGMWKRIFNNKWNYISGKQKAIITMVSYHMVGSCTKNWGKCL